MLKESYKSISFPLEKQDPEFIAKKYLNEFGITVVDSEEQILLIFAHALRDFLNGMINEGEFASLCFFFVSNKSMYSLIEQNSELDKYISDCADISWLSQSDSFSTYKSELQKYVDSVGQKI